MRSKKTRNCSKGWHSPNSDELKAEQEAAFGGLNDALSTLGQRLEELLGDIQAAVVETRDTVLDIRVEQERQGRQNSDMYQAVIALQQKLDMMHTQVRPRDSLSIRSDDERRLVRQLVAKYRAMPEDQRRAAPALLNAVGQLEVAAGDFQAAQQDFQTVASLVTDNAAKGEAHINAYRAALEKREFPAAIRELVEAVKLDGKRFAPFPVGKYLPQKILGAGGFGVAFLCKHKYLNAPVVVKALLGDDLDRNIDQVFSEAQALQQIEHPAIIRLQDCGYVDAAKRSRPFIVMDYFDGTTLEDYVLTKGPLSVDEMIALVGPVAAGMQAAHGRNILHRDIKPANLLVKRLPDVQGKPQWAVKLIDFGLALRPQALKDTSRQQKTLSGASIAGTIDYAAPEQMGKLPGVQVDKRADVYGFGKTVCFALFQTTQPLLKHWKSIPQTLAELLERCLAETPEDRPVDFGVVSRCFQRLQGGSTADSSIAATPTSGVARQGSGVTTASRSVGTRIDDSIAKTKKVVEPTLDELIAQSKSSGVPKGVWIAVGAVALLMVLSVGGYFVINMFRNRGSGGPSPTVASNDTRPNNSNDTRPSNPLPPVDTGNGGGPKKPRDTDPGTKTPAKADRIYRFTVKDVPTQLAATFIEERITDLLNTGNRDAWGKTDGPLGAIVKNSSKYTGTTLSMTVRSYPEKDALAAIRLLDLGVIDADGDNVTISVVAPAAPLRVKNPRPAGTKLTRAQVNAVLVALQPNGKNQNEALKLLELADPNDDNRAQIRTALLALVSGPRSNQEALPAIAVWGTVEDAKYLVSLGEQQVQHLGAARPFIDALGRLGDPVAASFLVRQIGNFFLGQHAITALREIGTPGEKAIQTGLNDSKEDVRKICCELLRDFGSTDSIKALKFASQDKNAEVVKAATLAWKTIAFHPIEPPKTVVDQGSAPPKPSTPKKTIDVEDLKVTVLDEAITSRTMVAIGDDGRAIYALDPASGTIRRLDWDGKEQASGTGGNNASVFTVCSEGVVVANPNDLKLLDSAKLTISRTAPFDNPRWIGATTGQSIAVARCESARTICLIDLNSFRIVTSFGDAKLGAVGKSEPVMTIDGKTVFTRGNGRLYRWRVEGNRLPFPEMGPVLGADGGQVVVSSDGRYVALFYSEGNSPEAGFPVKVPTGSTCICTTADFKKPAYVIDHGVKALALALDPQGAWVSIPDKTLIRYGLDGKKKKEYPAFATGTVKQLLLSPDGTRMAIVTDTKLYGVQVGK